MSDRYIDGILAYVDGEMTTEHRDRLVAELKKIEEDLINYRDVLDKWEGYAHRVRTEAHTPDDLREGVLKTLEIKRDVVKSTERVRAYIIRELYDQPQYRSAFEYSN